MLKVCKYEVQNEKKKEKKKLHAAWQTVFRFSC